MRDPRQAFEEKLVELGRKNDAIYAVSCDSASGGGLGEFFRQFPHHSVEVGISEQCGVSICAAMAKQGLIPVLVIINPFLTMRAYEQIRDDLGYADTNVKIVGSGGGLAYSTLGSTHIAVEDIALMRTIPHLTILAPGDADEVEFALEQALMIDGPVYIRMPRQKRKAPKPVWERRLSIGKAEVLKEGDDAVIFTYGPSVEEAVKAAELLQKEGVDCSVLNLTTLMPLDESAVLQYARRAKAVYTLEEHSPVGGLGDAVAAVMAEHKVAKPFVRMAVPKGAKQTGPYEELVEYYGLDGRSVAERILEQTHHTEGTRVDAAVLQEE